MKIWESPAVWRWLFGGLALGGALYLLYLLQGVLFSFLLALVLSYLLSPLVVFFEKRHLPRGGAVTCVYLILGLAFFLFGFYGFPQVARELEDFATTLPSYAQEGGKTWQDFRQRYLVNLPEGIQAIINETIRQGENLLYQGIRKTGAGLASFFSQVLNLILVPVLAFYMLKDREQIGSYLRQVIPLPYRRRVLNFWKEVDLVIKNFVFGRLLVALIVGIMTTAGLALLKMDFAFLLGMIAGLTDIIPYFGPILGGILIVALALLRSPLLALYTLILLFIIQQVESNIIAPKIIGDRLGMHPLVVIFAVLAGGVLGGILGTLVAVPLVAILRVFLVHLYVALISPKQQPLGAPGGGEEGGFRQDSPKE